jgi:hypothetical protein
LVSAWSLLGQQAARKRHAERRFPMFLSTVDGEGLRSLAAPGGSVS